MSWRSQLRIVLVQPRNSLNIGAAARAMLNFGFTELWLVNPYELAFRKARSAVHATEVLERARVTGDLSEALGDVSLTVASSGLVNRSSHHVQRKLPEGAPALRTHLESAEAALVFGSEKTGLSNYQLGFCDWLLTIPTDEACPSMNLGQAVAVCCYEISRRAQAVPHLQTPATATAEQRDRIVRMLDPVLDQSGFLHKDGRESHIAKVRRFVNRLRLAPADARFFQGMLRQIRWRLEHPSE